MNNKELCIRCDREGTLSCIRCNFNSCFVVKSKEDTVVDEHNRMTKYLRDKYGEDFKET